MQATPRDQGIGYISDLLAATYGERVPAPIQFIAKALGAEAMSKTLGRIAYGEPLTTGAGGIGGTSRFRPEVIESAAIATPMLGKVAQVTRGMPVGMSIKNVSPPQAEALRLAQQRAALPVEKGGLGLPANNTAAERAAAMGFDNPSYHSTNKNVGQFDLSKHGSTTDVGDFGEAVYTSSNPKIAGNYAKGEGQNIMPLLSNAKNQAVITGEKSMTDFLNRFGGDEVFFSMSPKEQAQAIKNAGIDTVIEPGYPQSAFYNPDQLRSRFAAFDPFRKTAATAAAMGVAAPDLLAQERPSDMQLQAMMLRDMGTDLNTIYQQTGVWLGQ